MTKNDPKLYREMSRPFETVEASNAALALFFEDVRAARIKHHISDALVLCEITVEVDGEEIRGSAMSHNGDSGRILPMLAREYGAAQQRHQEELGLIIARAKKSVPLK